MTAQTLTLTDFLLARIAEDEAVAVAADTVDRDYPSSISVIADDTDGGFLSIDIAPERVLAEVAAKRRIVERCAPLDDMQVRRQARTLAYETLRALALPYADHPDFCDEWRA